MEGSSDCAFIKEIYFLSKVRFIEFWLALRGRVSGLSRVSQWRKRVSLKGSPLDVATYWFDVSCIKRLGDSRLTKFWYDV